MKGRSRIREIADLLDLVYRIDLPQADWQQSLAEEMFRRRGLGPGMLSYEFDASGSDGYVRIGTVAGAGDIDDFLTLSGPVHDEPMGKDYALAIARGTHVGTTIETVEKAGQREPDSSPMVRRIRKAGIRDIWAVFSVNPDARGIAFAIPTDREKPLCSRQISEQWTQIGVHIAASFRLRRKLTASPADEAAGVLTPEGRPEHLVDGAVGDREALCRFAKALDKARARDARGEDQELLSLWRGLLKGRWSVFDRVDTDGKRYMFVYENDPEAVGPRELTARETQVATYAAQGHPNKTISYELGIARSTVAVHLRGALSKLGLQRRSDLIWVYGQLQGPGA